MTTWSPSPGPTAWTLPLAFPDERPAGTSAHQGSRSCASPAVTLVVACTPVTWSVSTPRCSCWRPRHPSAARACPRSCSSASVYPTHGRIQVVVSAPEVVALAPRGVRGRHSDRAHRHAPIPPEPDAPARAPDPAAAPHRDQRSQAVRTPSARACLHRRLLPRSPRCLPSSTAADKPSRAVSVVEVTTTDGRDRWCQGVVGGPSPHPPRQAATGTLRLVTTRHLCHPAWRVTAWPWPPTVADGGRARRQPADDPRDRRRRQGGRVATLTGVPIGDVVLKVDRPVWVASKLTRARTCERISDSSTCRLRPMGHRPLPATPRPAPRSVHRAAGPTT